MNKEKLFVTISSIVNAILLLFIIYATMYLHFEMIGVIMIIFPLLVAGITLFISNKVKKHSFQKSMKYANIAYFLAYVIPLGLFALALILFPPRVVAMYGVEMPIGVEECLEYCRELGEQTSEYVQECMSNCFNRR